MGTSLSTLADVVKLIYPFEVFRLPEDAVPVSLVALFLIFLGVHLARQISTPEKLTRRGFFGRLFVPDVGVP